MFIKRICSLSRTFYSPYQLPLTIGVSSNKFHLLRLSSTSTKQEENEPNSQVDKDRHINLIKQEIELMRQNGKPLDINMIRKHHWDDLLMAKTKTARKGYYRYLFVKEQTKKNKQLKLQRKHQEQGVWLHPSQQKDDDGGSSSTFLLPFGRRAINRIRNSRLWRAAQFGEKLIFDCSYDEYMNLVEAKSTANQLAWSFTFNRNDTEPFDIHFCNVNFNSPTTQQLHRNIPTMRDTKFPMHFHEVSYVDLFPRERLVYLTPHCDNDLTEYDPDMIYIIGAMVDKSGQGPLSFAKADALNLKMARLPLEQHLKWENGSKYLTLDQMVRVMLDLKRTGKWEVALRHVPRRKASSIEK